MLKLAYSRCEHLTEHELGRALAQLLLCECGYGELSYDPRGKPICEGGYVGISHSGGICAAAVSDSEVGVDIEVPKKRTKERLIALARRYFAPDELSYLEAAPETRFYELWCAKESYVKFTGNGLSEGLTSFSTLDGGLGVELTKFRLCEAYGCICAEKRENFTPIFIPENKIITSQEKNHV